MKNEDISSWMVKHKFAKNDFNASAIFRGLQLYNVPRFWERAKRVIMYRQWRDAGEKSSIAFANVNDGKLPPKGLL